MSDNLISIHNLSRPQTPIIQAKYCASFLCRLRGLSFRRSLPLNYGLLLVQKQDSRVDSSIHMLFMWMDLAVVWINGNQTVVDVQHARAWRPAYWSKSPARYVLEMSTHHLFDFAIGDRLSFEQQAGN